MSVTVTVRLSEREADALLRSELREVVHVWVCRQTNAQRTAQMKLYHAVLVERMDDAS